MSALLDLRSIARVLGGEVAGRDSAICPGPNYSRRDRSLSILLSASSPLGFVVFSHAGDLFEACQAYVAERLGLDPEGWKTRDRGDRPTPKPRQEGDDVARERTKARWFWSQRQPIARTAAEVYLRKTRGYGGVIPPTLAFLPARDGHVPALIAAFGIATEPECGQLAIAAADVMAVQLIKLKPDGSGKVDVEPQKIIVGKGALGSPIVLAPPNDLLGLAITEGLEDALSVHEATGLGVWAAGGAGRMPALPATVPEYVECVTLIGDNNQAGRDGATKLAVALKARGFEVVIKILGADR